MWNFGRGIDDRYFSALAGVFCRICVNDGRGLKD